jgi:hypothetical protein
MVPPEQQVEEPVAIPIDPTVFRVVERLVFTPNKG